MASELSSFIEAELRKQGIADDEEQRLLSNLRVKPLSVQAPGAAGGAAGWSGRKKAAVALGLALLFGALVALVLHYRGHPALTTGRFHGAIVDPEAGVEFIPDPASVTAQDADFHKAKSEFEEAAAKLEAEAEAEGKRAESKIEDAHADAAAHGGGAHNATEHAGGAPQGGDGGRRRRLLRGL